MNIGKTIITISLLAACFFSVAATAIASDKHNLRTITGKEDVAPVQIAFWYKMTNYDPAYTTILEHIVIFGALFEGLVRSDREGNLVPAQARSWTISSDGKRYEFKLRDDIIWSDGKPVVAQDYVLAFQRIVDPNLKQAPKPDYLLTIVKNALDIIEGKKAPSLLGVSAPDSKTLVIELNTPASYFLEILDYPGLVPVPSHMLRQYGNAWWQQSPLVTNGPYQLVDAANPKLVTLQLRDAQPHQHAPKVVKIVTMENMKQAVGAIVSGKLDIAWDLRKQEVEWMEGRLGIQKLNRNLPMTIYAIFNTQHEKLKDKRVRQALNLAIDRQKIASSSSNPVANTFAEPGMLSHVNDELPKPHEGLSYEQRVETARALMKQAGFSPENPLDLTIMASNRESLETASIALRSMFSQIWVNARLESVASDQLSPRLEAKDYEVSVGLWSGDYNDAMTFYMLLRKDAGKNHSAFSHAQYDELIMKALLEQDSIARQKIYAKLENILLDESPIVPLNHGTVQMIASKRIKGLGIDTMFLFQVHDIVVGEAPQN